MYIDKPSRPGSFSEHHLRHEYGYLGVHSGEGANCFRADDAPRFPFFRISLKTSRRSESLLNLVKTQVSHTVMHHGFRMA